MTGGLVLEEQRRPSTRKAPRKRTKLKVLPGRSVAFDDSPAKKSRPNERTSSDDEDDEQLLEVQDEPQDEDSSPMVPRPTASSTPIPNFTIGKDDGKKSSRRVLSWNEPSTSSTQPSKPPGDKPTKPTSSPHQNKSLKNPGELVLVTYCLKNRPKIYLGEVETRDDVNKTYAVRFLRSVDATKKTFKFHDTDQDNINFDEVLDINIPNYTFSAGRSSHYVFSHSIKIAE